MDNRQHFQFCIERFDHFYDTVNNKSALFLAINTFIVGGLIAVYPSLLALADIGTWTNSIFTFIIIVGLVSILITLSAAIPFLSKPNASLLYFESIATRSLGDFKTEMSSLLTDHFENDYATQVHELSVGLRNKFRRLQWAGYAIFIEFLLMIPLFILIMNNIKNTK